MNCLGKKHCSAIPITESDVQHTASINVLYPPPPVLTAIFPGGPRLAGTRISPFWILLELRIMDVVVTTRASL